MIYKAEMPLAEEYYQNDLDAQVWSSAEARAEWKREAVDGIAAAAEKKQAAFDRYMRSITEESEPYDQRSEGGWM